MAKKVIEIVNPKASITFQSYAEAYDEDFEDIRRRVPDLTRLRSAIQYEPKYALDDIIRSVHEYQKLRLTQKN